MATLLRRRFARYARAQLDDRSITSVDTDEIQQVEALPVGDCVLWAVHLTGVRIAVPGSIRPGSGYIYGRGADKIRRRSQRRRWFAGWAVRRAGSPVEHEAVLRDCRVPHCAISDRVEERWGWRLWGVRYGSLSSVLLEPGLVDCYEFLSGGTVTIAVAMVVLPALSFTS
jgi:hypothetical protein